MSTGTLFCLDYAVGMNEHHHIHFFNLLQFSVDITTVFFLCLVIFKFSIVLFVILLLCLIIGVCCTYQTELCSLWGPGQTVASPWPEGEHGAGRQVLGAFGAWA